MNTVTKTGTKVKPQILDIPWVTAPKEVEYTDSEYHYGNGTNGASEYRERKCAWSERRKGEKTDDKLYARIAKNYSRELAERDEDDNLFFAV